MTKPTNQSIQAAPPIVLTKMKSQEPDVNPELEERKEFQEALKALLASGHELNMIIDVMMQTVAGIYIMDGLAPTHEENQAIAANHFDVAYAHTLEHLLDKGMIENEKISKPTTN